MGGGEGKLMIRSLYDPSSKTAVEKHENGDVFLMFYDTRIMWTESTEELLAWLETTTAMVRAADKLWKEDEAKPA
jgi:hypothetical protein